MENGRNINASGTQDSFIMKALEQKERSRSHNDIMNLRMKNRERQRRYRARKRLEAETKQASFTNQSITAQVESQSSGNHNNCLTRVHCKRNWKKDARAHACQNLKETPSAAVSSTALALNIGSQTPSLAPEINAELPPEMKAHSENCERSKTKLRRRDWKAEARNKKN